MKIFVTFWLMVMLTSCSLMPEISFLEEEIENEIVIDAKIGLDAIEKRYE